MKKVFRIIASVFLGWLFMNCFFWLFCWLVGDAFDKVGWLRMPLDMFQYKLRDVPMDFVVQTIAGIIYIIMFFGAMFMIYAASFSIFPNPPIKK